MTGKLYLIAYELSRLLLNLILINVLWIGVNIPVLVLFIQIALTEEIPALYVLIPITALLLPLLFFPGTQALMNSVREMIKEDSLFNPIDFFRLYRLSYKHSFIIGLYFTSSYIILGGLFYLIGDAQSLLSLLVLVIGGYVAITAYMMARLEAHYRMSIIWKISQAYLFIFRYPLFALLNFTLVFILQYIIYSVSPILFILFGPAMTMYFTTHLFMRKLTTIKRRADTLKKTGA